MRIWLQINFPATGSSLIGPFNVGPVSTKCNDFGRPIAIDKVLAASVEDRHNPCRRFSLGTDSEPADPLSYPPVREGIKKGTLPNFVSRVFLLKQNVFLRGGSPNRPLCADPGVVQNPRRHVRVGVPCRLR